MIETKNIRQKEGKGCFADIVVKKLEMKVNRNFAHTAEGEWMDKVRQILSALLH